MLSLKKNYCTSLNALKCTSKCKKISLWLQSSEKIAFFLNNWNWNCSLLKKHLEQTNFPLASFFCLLQFLHYYSPCQLKVCVPLNIRFTCRIIIILWSNSYFNFASYSALIMMIREHKAQLYLVGVLLVIPHSLRKMLNWKYKLKRTRSTAKTECKSIIYARSFKNFGNIL